MPTDDQSAFAEFGELFRMPIPDDDLMSNLPLEAARFEPRWPLVDLGAGPGYGALALITGLPDARVVAVEPSASMRVLAMSRFAAMPADQRARVTLIPDDLFMAQLPPVWGGCLAIHLICQLTTGQRQRLWPLLAGHLAPGAPIVLDRCYGVPVADASAERMTGEVRLGDRTYQRWFRRDPVDPTRVKIRVTYRILCGDKVVGERSTESGKLVLNEAAVIEEAAAAGLTATPADERFLLLRR